jgi:hypothetical protein
MKLTVEERETLRARIRAERVEQGLSPDPPDEAFRILARLMGPLLAKQRRRRKGAA